MKINDGFDFLAFSLVKVLRVVWKMVFDLCARNPERRAVGRCSGSNDSRKRIQLAFNIYSDFMQGLFYPILSGESI